MDYQGDHATDIKGGVGPDEDLIGVVDEAFMDRHEDLLEKEQDGQLGEADPKAVYDGRNVLKLMMASQSTNPLITALEGKC